MIKEMEIMGVQIADGKVITDIKAITEKGPVGMRFAFETRKQQGIAAGVTMLEDEIEKAVLGTLCVEKEADKAEAAS